MLGKNLLTYLIIMLIRKSVLVFWWKCCLNCVNLFAWNHDAIVAIDISAVVSISTARRLKISKLKLLNKQETWHSSVLFKLNYNVFWFKFENRSTLHCILYKNWVGYLHKMKWNTFFKLMFGTNSICYQRPKAGYET